MPSSQHHLFILLLVAAAWGHAVRSTVPLGVRLAGRHVVHVAGIVVGSSAHGLSVRRELCAYFQDLGDPGSVWALPDVDEEIVGDFPEHEEYEELQKGKNQF